MEKLVACVVVLLAAVFVAEGVTIPAQKIGGSGKFFASSRIPQNVTPNDPRCKTNGIFANLKDCTAYYACVNGTSQDRKCPEGMKFDSHRHCTFDEDADCGVTPRINGDLIRCPESYGNYPYRKDCHKYINCDRNVPTLKSCPDNQWFLYNHGCIVSDKCPTRGLRRSNKLTDVIEN